MTRFRRLVLIVLLFVGIIATQLANRFWRPWLTDAWGSEPLANAFNWMFFTFVWMLPLLHPKVRRNVRFQPSRRTWTVLLLLPYPLLHTAFGQSLPVLRQSIETSLLVPLAFYITLFSHAFWEELLLRGYAIYQAGSNPRFAIVVSAVFFVALHAPTRHSPYALILIFFFGIATALVRFISGGLAWPIVFHVVNNLLVELSTPNKDQPWTVICIATAAISSLLVLWKHPMWKKEDAGRQIRFRLSNRFESL